MTQTVDIFEISRTRRVIEGDLGLDDLPDLAQMLEGENRFAHVHYRASGTAGHAGKPGAELTIRARIGTRCVRCSEPLEVQIDTTVPFLFTRTEEEADSMPISEDGDYEVVVGSDRFDLVHWIEEEVILSLPAFPSHATCADVRVVETEPKEKKSNPFAALAALKKAS